MGNDLSISQNHCCSFWIRLFGIRKKLSSKMVQMGEQIHSILLNFQHMHLNKEAKTGWSRVLSNASCLFC